MIVLRGFLALLNATSIFNDVLESQSQNIIVPGYA
jgi:hypothetical protein